MDRRDKSIFVLNNDGQLVNINSNKAIFLCINNHTITTLDSLLANANDLTLDEIQQIKDLRIGETVDLIPMKITRVKIEISV